EVMKIEDAVQRAPAEPRKYFFHARAPRQPPVGRIDECRDDHQGDGAPERFRVAAHDEDGHPRRGDESERGVTMDQPGCELTCDHHFRTYDDPNPMTSSQSTLSTRTGQRTKG